MSAPNGFSWVEKPVLAALARPALPDLLWLKEQGIELLISLTEDRVRRDWAEDAGLLVFHEPLEDMEAPSQDQLDRVVSALQRAQEKKIPTAIHCEAGQGRTGVVLAAYFVAKGFTAQNAMGHVRRLRPGSIETDEQAEAVELFARRRRQGAAGEKKP